MEVKFEAEETRVSALISGLGRGGVGVGVGAVVAEAATALSSDEARGEGVVAPETGGVGSVEVSGAELPLTRCSVGAVLLNMASI